MSTMRRARSQERQHLIRHARPRSPPQSSIYLPDELHDQDLADRSKHRRPHHENANRESNGCAKALCMLSTLVLVVLIFVVLAIVSGEDDAFQTTSATFDLSDLIRDNRMSSSSTGSSLAIDSFSSSSGSGASTDDTFVTAGFQSGSGTVADPACTISNVEIGFAQCSNRIVNGFSTDTLFNPNAAWNLGNCIVPYMHINLRQFISIRTITMQAGQFWNLYDLQAGSTSTPIAQYTQDNALVQYIQNNKTNVPYRIETYFTDSNPLYYYRNEPRQCQSSIDFVLEFEQCQCSSGSANGTTSVFQQECDCTNFSSPISVESMLMPANFSSSSSSTGSSILVSSSASSSSSGSVAMTPSSITSSSSLTMPIMFTSTGADSSTAS